MQTRTRGETGVLNNPSELQYDLPSEITVGQFAVEAESSSGI